MDSYLSSEDLERTSNLKINSNQFGDVELIATLATQRELEKDALFHIGTGGSIATQILLHKAIIYFGCCDHNFYALSARTGERLNRFTTKGQTCMGCRPALNRDVIYFPSFDGNLYAVNLDLKEVWRFGTNSKLASSPIVADNRIYFGAENGNFYSIDQQGRLLWKFSTKDANRNPVLLDNTIYFGSYDNNLYAVNTDGRLLWKFPTKNQIAGRPSFYKDRIYFGSLDKNVYCLDLYGNLLWTFPTNGPIYDVTVHKGVLYFGSWDKNFYAVSAENGNLLWKFGIQNLIFCAPTISGDTIYFGNYDNLLYAVTLDGRLKWTFPTNGHVGEVLVHNNTVYFGCFDCNFYAVTKEGKLKWKFPTSISTPSKVDLSAITYEQSFEVAWQRSETEEKKEEKYKSLETLETESLSKYVFKSNYVSKSKRYT